MDITPSKISEMMTLLDEHQEHMPDGTRLALCNKLLECKEEERIEYEITLMYPATGYVKCEDCSVYQLETEMSTPIKIITLFTESEFNNFENQMEHRKYGSPYNLVGTEMEDGLLKQIMNLQSSIDYEMRKCVKISRDMMNDRFELSKNGWVQMMIVDYKRRI